MGQSRRRKAKDPNYGKVKQKLVRGSVSYSFKPLREYVEDSTRTKGRGYVACAKRGCVYYGREDFLGDEDDFLLDAVKDYDPDFEAIVVQQLSPNMAVFSTEVVALDELSNI